MERSAPIRHLIFILCCLLLMTGYCEAGLGKAQKKRVTRSKANVSQETEGTKTEGTKTEAPQPPAPDKRKKRLYEVYDPFCRHYANMILGVNVMQGDSALVMGGQFGFALQNKVPFYLGPEINFSLYSPGSILMTLVGGWYQMRIHRSPRLLISGGLLLGPAFASSNYPVVGRTSFATFLEAVISQEVDDLFSVRGQLRPGFINGVFAFMMNLNVSFRFK